VNDYTAATYGDRIAESYDRMYPGGGGVEPSVNVLAKLAGGGRALELGIGTGRVALPLAERGVTVQGIDASQAMVDRLRAKPGGDAIPVTIGDFAEFQVDSRFELIFVCNTLFGLATQDAQVQCFQRVAEHLAAGGTFLIEAFVPDPARFVGGRNLSVTGIEPDLVTLDVARHDAANQRVYSQHLLLTEAGTRLYPVQLRYAWPSEPDLMARLAGLRLRDRWSGWDGAPFTAASGSHISVYERAPDPPA
jgi:SAM-dependent methyltransferase